ncbi:hypothetical protein [Acinetobacter sp. Marseille-Q1623]|uniref:hypothetical protein n=1 Tax=Acinetobacter sp. Marseille-Q1623 TaxID=2697501 RepID=UPI00157B05D2|nr:hypothetical protein [Acinetobacter sp. Marseille-Q1623]
MHLYQVDNPINLARLVANFDIPALRFKPFQPVIPKVVRNTAQIFEVLSKRDVLLFKC